MDQFGELFAGVEVSEPLEPEKVVVKKKVRVESQQQLSTVTGTDDDSVNWMIDPETNESIPAPIAEYEPIYYWRVQENG